MGINYTKRALSNAIAEGINMGTKALAKPTKQKYTIGFEFELTTGQLDHEEAYENFYNEWYAHQSENYPFEDWFDDAFGSYGSISIDDIKNAFDLRYSVPTLNQYIASEKESKLRSTKRRNPGISVQVLDKLAPYIEAYRDDPNMPDDEKFKALALYHVLVFPEKYNDIDEMTERTKAKGEVAIQWFNNTFGGSLMTLYTGEPDIDLDEVKDEYDDLIADNNLAFDKDGDVIILSGDVYDLEDIIAVFDVDASEMEELFAEEYSEASMERMDDAFNDWFHSNSVNLMDYVSNNIIHDLNRKHSSNGKRWNVVPDGTDGVDAEVVSPAFDDFNQGIAAMKYMFEIIQYHDELNTSGATGLHINIGTWRNREEVNSVDWLKFMVIYQPHKVSEAFGRKNNYFAASKMDTILAGIANGDLDYFYQDIEYFNRIVIDNSPKYSTINFSKLNNPNWGIIEFRGPGNEGYEYRGDYLAREIRRLGRALDIASDREAYKKEYAKKLYTMLSPVQQQRSNNASPMIKRATSLKQFLQSVSSVAYPLDRNTPTNRILNWLYGDLYRGREYYNRLNSNYSSAIHRDLVGRIHREKQNTNGSDVPQNLLNKVNDLLHEPNTADSKLLQLLKSELERMVKQ